MISTVKNWFENFNEFIGLGKEDRVEKAFLKKEKIPVQPSSTTVDPIYENMTKRELETYAREEFKVDLDRRHNKKRLVSQVKKLAKGK